VVVVPEERAAAAVAPVAEIVTLDHIYQQVVAVEPIGMVVANLVVLVVVAHNLVILRAQVILRL
jgi:hypothetical protein